MGKDVSLAVSLSDKVSPVLKAMTGYTKAFDKSMEDLDRQVHTLEKSQKELAAETTTLRVRLTQANEAVKLATKDYKKYGDALHMKALQDAIDEQESELSLIDSVRNNTALNDAYYDAGARLGTAFSRGRLSTIADNSAFLAIPDISGNVTTVDLSAATGLNGYATGLSRVPYDNFPALLHEGERVMTAAEARSADNRAVQVTISGNEFVVRQDSDIDAIATALADKIRLAALSGVTTWQ